ncbi:tripartite tricarboxylate transporter substrate binding protein [Polaromonas sp. SM01]|uniref:tripartite tricarboxylate transporter substrate binding protein n=1 Tax=Polaromonas sp. SM01 TaxID=3085630 RepID=UPI0029815EA9|nr:tripartite tricarboxylate transporter substrate binding protein [Polaromonas sp. SM01]MDW5444150.1 tripartite tricarboxylate transporter substrate binding protein [Polaromonas sp. SM01]
MKTIRTRLAAILACAAALIGPGPALATDAWPSKPVNIVVSFVPGGATDLVGRILATELGVAFKQPFIVSNRPGAAGQVGTEYVANQPNDGYTLLISATGHVMAPAIQPKVNYHPVKSFEPIALLVTMPNLLVVNPNIPAKTLPEFIKWARTQSSVPFGTAGAGGATHLSGELFRHISGLPLSHIPYKGNGPSMTDVMGGQIPAAFVDTVSVGNLVTAGKVRAIAVTSGQRSKLYPDVATFAEAGYKDYDLENWVGLYAPAGTPAEIFSRLNREVVRIMNSPEVLARMQKLGADSTNKFDPQRFSKYVEDETNKWRKTIQVTGVKVEN